MAATIATLPIELLWEVAGLLDAKSIYHFMRASPPIYNQPRKPFHKKHAETGKFALSWAALTGNRAVAELSIEAGADLNQLQDMENMFPRLSKESIAYPFTRFQVPLYWTVTYHNLDIVYLLIDKGANMYRFRRRHYD